jgi:hypothetical protein
LWSLDEVWVPRRWLLERSQSSSRSSRCTASFQVHRQHIQQRQETCTWNQRSSIAPLDRIRTDDHLDNREGIWCATRYGSTFGNEETQEDPVKILMRSSAHERVGLKHCRDLELQFHIIYYTFTAVTPIFCLLICVLVLVLSRWLGSCERFVEKVGGRARTCVVILLGFSRALARSIASDPTFKYY